MDDERKSIGSQSMDAVPIPPEMVRKLVIQPTKEYHRLPNMIPFHIPHKKLLEKIEFKRELPEPLAGFRNRQKRFRKQKIDDVERYPLRKMSRVTSAEGHELVTFADESDQYKNRLRMEIEPDASFIMHKISYKLAPVFARTSSKVVIVDQPELIERIKSDPKSGFVYLTYSVPRFSEYFTPYCLKIVPYREIDKTNFLTMSSHGVTQYRGTDVTYTPIEQWEHEYTMYCKLMTIKIFRLYTEWKAFYVWRKSIVTKKYRDAQRKLNNSLFCLNSELRNTLITVKAMCRDMEKFLFTESSSIENWNLFYFIEMQMGKVQYIKEKMDEFRETIKLLLNNTCHAVLYEAGYTTDDRNFRLSISASTGKPKPMMSYIEQAKKKRTCVKISRFITVIDYIILGSLQTFLVNSATDFLKIFTAHYRFVPDIALLEQKDIDKEIVVPRPSDAPQLPLIIVDLESNAFGLGLNPSQNDVHDAFLNLMNLWEEITCGLKPFLADKFFNPFIQPMINNKYEDRLTGYGPLVVTVLRDDVKYNWTRAEVLRLIDENYRAAMIYIERFQPIYDFIAEDIAMDHEKIKNETILEMFRMYIKRYHDEIDLIEQVNLKQHVGLLSIHMKLFVMYVMPEPSSLLQTCETTLPWLGKTRTDALINSVNDASNYLENDPRVTTDYVEYLDFIDRSIGLLDTMESELEYLKEMYDMMEEYHINIPVEDFSEYLSLSVVIANFRVLVDKKTEEKDKVVSKFNDQISKDISGLIEEVGAIKDELLQPWLIDVATNVNDAIPYLQGLSDHLIECQQKATTLKNYQKMIRAEVTRFDMLNEVINDVKLRSLLWETVVDWTKTMEEWHDANFATMDPEEMSTYTMKNVKNVSKLEKGLPPNEIVPKLKEEVENMKDKLPVIKNLRNPALRTRHWARIEIIINYKFKADEMMTLQLLESIGAFNYPTELTEVSGQASSETGLETMLKKVSDQFFHTQIPNCIRFR